MEHQTNATSNGRVAARRTAFALAFVAVGVYGAFLLAGILGRF